MQYINQGTPAFFAFNVWDVNSACAVLDAAATFQQDVILQTSERIFKNLYREGFRRYIKDYAKKKEINAYIHLDHCKNMESIQDAIENHWDSVMFDGSSLPIEDNINLTNIVCNRAHPKNVLVEAEIGRIQGVEDDITVRETGIANLENVKFFLKNTSVDMLAVAFGTAHGVYGDVPCLHYELLDAIDSCLDIPFVVHGGSGLSENILKKLLQRHCVKKINISTDVKHAYREAILTAQKQGKFEGGEFSPNIIEIMIHDAILEMAYSKFQVLESG